MKQSQQRKMKHMNHKKMNQSQVIAVLKMKDHVYQRPKNQNFFERI